MTPLLVSYLLCASEVQTLALVDIVHTATNQYRPQARPLDRNGTYAERDFDHSPVACRLPRATPCGDAILPRPVSQTSGGLQQVRPRP